MSRAERAEERQQAEGPGPLLERERERQGLSRQQVAERLNLDVGVIDAIETENYVALGAPVFAKGHLGHYASLLGLPVDATLDAYSRSQNQVSQPTLVPKSRFELPQDDRRPRWPWVVGGLMLFLVAAAVVAYVSEYGFRLPFHGPSAVFAHAPEPEKAETTRVVAAEAADGAASRQGGEPGMEAAAVPAAPASQSESVPTGDEVAPSATRQPGQLELELRFSADSWVEIYDRSGQAVFYDLGRAGTARTVLAAAPLSVTLGNAGAVGLSISGRSVSLPQPVSGQTVSRFSIDPEGALR